MIQVFNEEVVGWESAIRGMRNPLNSWDKSDSTFCWDEDSDCEWFKIGDNDLNLMTKLRKAGTDHRKFMRMLTVYADINAPLYWWKEYDTYKVGTVANSCSTMHKIHAKEFTLDDFSWEQLLNTGCNLFEKEWENGLFRQNVQPLQLMTDFIIPSLNVCREKFLETKNKAYWWQMIQLLPSSYNQKRTVMLNYEVLANMYKSRKSHKLDEWRDFCKWIESLPHSELITGNFEVEND